MVARAAAACDRCTRSNRQFETYHNIHCPTSIFVRPSTMSLMKRQVSKTIESKPLEKREKSKNLLWQHLNCCGAKFDRSSNGTTASKADLTWAINGSKLVSSCFLTVKLTNSGKFSCETTRSREAGVSADGTSSQAWSQAAPYLLRVKKRR